MISVDLRKALGSFTLDVAFDAPRGVTAIFGRSGSGKTSLINMIAGLVHPDHGHIDVAGRRMFDTTQVVPAHQRNLGYVFQDARLFPHLTVAKNLTFGGNHDHDRIVEMLGIGALLTRKPHSLSGGEKQRVALARALMSNPDMLLLDEPLAALDGPRKEEILPYLERLRDEFTMPMIYVSHAVSEVARLANHIVVLDGGRVVQSGPLADVLAQPASMSLLGVRDAGAVIVAKVMRHDQEECLTELDCDGLTIALPGQVGRIGQALRIRIPAQDIILAAAKPVMISARNVFPVTVTAIEMGRGPGVAVGLMAGKTPLLARITKASLHDLGLKQGAQIFAILKATAVAREDIGR